jgi:hypothetical protein
MDESLREVVDEIEAEKALGRVAGYEVFRSRISQPNLLAVRSTDAIQNNSEAGYSEMLFNIPRSILEVETIQLLTANIPQCVQNIPDTALVFWYYRLNAYQGLVPNSNNLYFVRLLPSYYKQEFITDPEEYGFNQTFNSYQELATQLALSCANDLGSYNQELTTPAPPATSLYDFRYLKSDISLPYNTSLNKFQMVGNNTITKYAYKTWNISANYGLNDTVLYSVTNKTYKSLTSGNVGIVPTNTTYWVEVAAVVIALYDNTTPYPVGRFVSYTNRRYKAILATTGNLPSNVTYWIEVIDGEDGVVNRYLYAGFNDPNIALRQSDTFRLWNEFALFEAATIVEYEGLFYQAAFQNQNIVPTNATYWTPTFTAPVVIGVNVCSSALDMVNVADAPFPEGIPGQPYNATPKRTLNSILGFTWNGLMDPSVLAAIVAQPSSIVTTSVLLYNRLRPVPLYISFLLASILGTPGPPTSSATDTFTAEGYCNLVYSSIISIYASVVYGSSTDSKRNTSLLACGSMNCANLGVSFFAGFIDNPLLIEGNDLYDLSITLQDEYGEPYVLTNNAVASFTFKMTYKTKG